MNHEATFIEIFDRYKNSIKRISCSYENNPEKAQELYQEIAVAVWGSMKNFNRECSEKTWIYRIACNKAITHVQKESKTSSFGFIPLEQLDDFLAGEDFEKRVEDRNLLALLNEIIKRLAPLDRQIFILYLEGFQHREISLISGILESNVSTKISRIKKSIKSLNIGGQE